MPSKAHYRRHSTRRLEFAVDSLERRRMLAAQVEVTGGDSLRIIGTNDSEILVVTTNEEGNVVVHDLSADDAVIHDTGLSQLKNLKVDLKGGSDTLTVDGTGDRALRVTGRTSIKLGPSGAPGNRLHLGGRHARLKIVGGKQSDTVFASALVRNANTKVKLKGGDDIFGFDIGITYEAADKGRLNEGDVGGRPLKVNLGSGDDILTFSDTRSDTTFLSDVAFGEVLLFATEANISGQAGTDSISPPILAEGIELTEGRLKSFEVVTDLEMDGLLPIPLGPDAVFNEEYYDALVGDTTPGAGNQDLIDAMLALSNENLTPSEVDNALNQIASVRGLTTEQVQAQYDRFLELKQVASEIGQANGQSDVLDLDTIQHPDYMGSATQLRFGKIIGDVLGLDPVFGSLLSPTGGLVGPGNDAFDFGDDAISFHGAVHDAAGYLFNYHNLGPGYAYLGDDPLFETSDPRAGQIQGVSFWYEKLDEGGLLEAIALLNLLFG